MIFALNVGVHDIGALIAFGIIGLFISAGIVEGAYQIVRRINRRLLNDADRQTEKEETRR